MDISTLFSLCAFGALIGVAIAFVKPSFFAYDGGKVPGRGRMAWIWVVVLIASMLAAAYHSDKEAQERIDAMRPADTDLVPPAAESPEESAPPQADPAQLPEPEVPPPSAEPGTKPDEPPGN